MPLAFPMRSHRSRNTVHVRNRRATRGGMMGGSLVRSCIGQSCAAGRGRQPIFKVATGTLLFLALTLPTVGADCC